jgi:chromosome segregation ATPase
MRCLTWLFFTTFVVIALAAEAALLQTSHEGTVSTVGLVSAASQKPLMRRDVPTSAVSEDGSLLHSSKSVIEISDHADQISQKQPAQGSSLNNAIATVAQQQQRVDAWLDQRQQKQGPVVNLTSLQTEITTIAVQLQQIANLSDKDKSLMTKLQQASMEDSSTLNASRKELDSLLSQQETLKRIQSQMDGSMVNISARIAVMNAGLSNYHSEQLQNQRDLVALGRHKQRLNSTLDAIAKNLEAIEIKNKSLLLNRPEDKDVPKVNASIILDEEALSELLLRLNNKSGIVRQELVNQSLALAADIRLNKIRMEQLQQNEAGRIRAKSQLQNESLFLKDNATWVRMRIEDIDQQIEIIKKTMITNKQKVVEVEKQKQLLIDQLVDMQNGRWNATRDLSQLQNLTEERENSARVVSRQREQEQKMIQNLTGSISTLAAAKQSLSNQQSKDIDLAGQLEKNQSSSVLLKLFR